MRYLTNKPNFKELLQCLNITNICYYVKYLGVCPYMITKTVKERLKILEFWRRFGDEAALAAYGAKRSTLYG